MAMTSNLPLENIGFSGLGIAPALFAVLEKLHFTVPTPIQHKSIPTAILGQDIVGVAQTGTGKTLAFGLPMIQRLNQIKGKGLILLPTRELALQVDESLRQIGASLGLKTAVLIGGAPMDFQLRALRRDPQIIIATPGRLNDHLEHHTIKLDQVKIVVLDEADKMLDMGFEPQIKTIFNAVSSDRQTLLFSATMPSAIFNLAKKYMKLPVQIEVAPTGTTVEKVTQEIFIVGQHEKLALTKKILEQYKGSILIFTRTKHGAKKLKMAIQALGYTAGEIHSNRSLNQRKEALQSFKLGRTRVLIATDIASRGIDVAGIELVLNYDLPDNSEDYVHRIGRTARAGALGHAISFATPNQRWELRNIEKLVQKSIPITKTPVLPVLPHGLMARDHGEPRRGRVVSAKKPRAHSPFNYPKRKQH